nr:hypothetical protein MACL_00001094 [Theileria orientalis]
MKNNKLNNVKIGKRIVVGTYAFPLNPSEKKRYGSMTHRWVCLLRSIDDENMSHYIKRVQFELDPSFLNPKRVVTSMPYEVTEVGWGEFFIGVKITFVDDSLEPVQLQHLLRLNPTDGTNIITTAVNETFDEIIFNEPKEWFYERLMKSACDKLPPIWNYEQKEKETLCRYICSQSYFQNETYRLLAEASELCKQIQRLQEQYHFGLNKPADIDLKDKTTSKTTPILSHNSSKYTSTDGSLSDMPVKKLNLGQIGQYPDSKGDTQESSNQSYVGMSVNDRDSLYSDRSHKSNSSNLSLILLSIYLKIVFLFQSKLFI